MPTFNFQPIRLLDPGCWYKFTYWMTNSADPDWLAYSETNWSGSTLFTKAVCISKFSRTRVNKIVKLDSFCLRKYAKSTMCTLVHSYNCNMHPFWSNALWADARRLIIWNNWLLAQCMLGKNFSRQQLDILFLFFSSENRLWPFMQIVSFGDNLHEKSKPIF